MQKSNFKLGMVACMLVLGTASCKYTKEPSPSFVCNASAPITFTNSISTIVSQNCAPGCHEPGGSFSSIPLTTAAEVESAIKNNRLISAIKQDGVARTMPPGQPRLPDDIISKVECWQTQGFVQ